MSTVFVTALLALLQTIANLTTPASEISRIIAALINLIPTLEAEFASVLPAVQNIIASLKSNGSVTPAQMAALQSLDAQCDAAFEAQVAAFTAANPKTPLPAPGA